MRRKKSEGRAKQSSSGRLTIGDDLFVESFRRGTDLLHKGKAAESLPFLQQAHGLHPDNVDVALNLGGAYILTKKFSKAVGVLEKASQENPDNSQIWINLGAAYLGNPVLASSEQQDKAIRAFERALEIDPVARSVAYNIGLVYRDKGEREQAIDWFRQALKHSPADEDARSLLAKLEQELGQ